MSYTNNTPYSSRLLFLDSNDSVFSNDEYTFDLESDIETPYASNMIISIKEVQIPNIFFNVLTGVNDTIVIIGSLTSIKTYTMPQKNYNVDEFRTTFHTLSVANGQNITVSIDDSTLLLTFTSLTEELTFTTATNMYMIGLTASVLPLTSYYGVKTMPYMFNFSSYPYIFLKSSLELKNINSEGSSQNNFLRIPMNVPFGFIVYHEPQEPTQYLSNKQHLTQIKFRLQSSSGLNLGLINHSFQVIIQIGYIYPPEGITRANVRQKHIFDMTPQEYIDEIKKN